MIPTGWAVAFVAALLTILGMSGGKPAERTAETVQVAPWPPNMAPRPTTPSWARCPQWWDTARAAGWPEGQLATLDYVMHRESNCEPGAYNRSGASGLTQLLGWRCPPNGCFDPWSNLHEAFVLWSSSGWRPWCLWGDPVTGSC